MCGKSKSSAPPPVTPPTQPPSDRAVADTSNQQRVAAMNSGTMQPQSFGAELGGGAPVTGGA